ncbi:toll/interleukin-1 receptor domain-containing protein [Rhizomicrobium electricum]|nr:toll/interleukin-1 receptor domain-containing protein [Rhizomicrobium electricum]NIJ50747.1 hypothetical protein [Rhizomicrobium electricum]
MKDLEKQIIDKALNELLKRSRAAGASLTDPETGVHPLVFAWRTPPKGVLITTNGSESYAIALERRLDKQRTDESKRMESDSPVVYLAHASEDKPAARPIAEHLVANGIEVWFDEWEIGAGDSLRRRMDEGLGACTHFVVLLTEKSLKRPWVNEEIDAGFVQKVEGRCKFIPLRMGLSLIALPPLLKGILSPEIDPESPPTLRYLVDQIHGVSAKPPLGEKPRYVQRVGGLAHLSPAAVAIGKHFANVNTTGAEFEPQLSPEEVADATGLSSEDVEIGILDLVQAGMLHETDVIGDSTVWALGPLFITFDEHVHGWRPADDARALAAVMVNNGRDEYDPEELMELTGWSKRRMNAALHAVEKADIARCEQYLDGTDWAVSSLRVSPQTRRAARSA